MWELDHKEVWVPKHWCFQTVVLEKTLANPLDCKEIKPVTHNEISPEYSLEGLMLKFQYFGHLMWRVQSLEKTLMLGTIKCSRRRRWQKMRWLDGIIDPMGLNLSKLWETVKDREISHTTAHGVNKESDAAAEQLNNNKGRNQHNTVKQLSSN